MTSSSDERVYIESRALEVVAVAMAAHAALTWTMDIQSIRSIATPTGIGTIIDLSPLLGTPVPWLILAAILVALGFGVAGWNRYAYFASVALLHLQFSLRYVHGKVPHAYHLIGLVLLAYAVARSVSTDPVRWRRLSLEYATGGVVALYFLASVSKLVATGPSWVNGANLSLWIAEKCVDEYSRTGMECRGFLAEMVTTHRFVGTAFLGSGLLIEFASPLALIERLRRPMFILFCSLHLGISLVLGIAFVQCMVILMTMAGSFTVYSYLAKLRPSWSRLAYAWTKP